MAGRTCRTFLIVSIRTTSQKVDNLLSSDRGIVYVAVSRNGGGKAKKCCDSLHYVVKE